MGNAAVYFNSMLSKKVTVVVVVIIIIFLEISFYLDQYQGQALVIGIRVIQVADFKSRLLYTVPWLPFVYYILLCNK